MLDSSVLIRTVLALICVIVLSGLATFQEATHYNPETISVPKTQTMTFEEPQSC